MYNRYANTAAYNLRSIFLQPLMPSLFDGHTASILLECTALQGEIKSEFDAHLRRAEEERLQAAREEEERSCEYIRSLQEQESAVVSQHRQVMPEMIYCSEGSITKVNY